MHGITSATSSGRDEVLHTEIMKKFCFVLFVTQIQPLGQWRTQEFFFRGWGSTNSVDNRENGDLGAAAP
jgi:hypothetical protein